MRCLILAIVLTTAFGDNVFGGKGDPDNGCPVPEIKPADLSTICAEIECAKFTKLDIDGCFEARKYSPAKWVSTEVPDSFMGFRKAFKNLFNYIEGANDQKEKIPMTAPVSNMLVMGSDEQVKVQYMSFLIGEAHRSSTPKPTNKDVMLVEEGEYTLYARAFGYTGFMASKSLIKQEFGILANELKKAGVEVEWSYPITMGYNSPWDSEKRFEVAFAAKAAPSPKPKDLDEICKDIECAKADIHDVKGAPNVQRKDYYEANVIMTEVDVDPTTKKATTAAYNVAFKRLYRYITGNNEKGMNINMTVPVRNKLVIKDNEVAHQFMSFVLPAALTDIPAPKDSKVVQTKEKAYSVYEKAFGGVISEADSETVYSREFKNLWAELTVAGIKPDFQELYTFEYTDPKDNKQRHEVAVLISQNTDIAMEI